MGGSLGRSVGQPASELVGCILYLCERTVSFVF